MAHALAISSRHLKRSAAHIQHLQSKLSRVSKHAEAALDQGMTAVLTVGTAAGLGLLHGRHGSVEVVGVPVELVVGGGATALSLFGFGGKYRRQIGAIGGGALSVYAYTMAKGAGQNMKAKAGGGADTTRGLPSERLTRQEINDMQEPVAAQRR